MSLVSEKSGSRWVLFLKKLLVTSATLLGTGALLVVTRSY